MASRVLITTSLRPSDESRSFGKLLARLIPNSQYLVRGSRNEATLYEFATKNDFTQIIILQSIGNKLSKLMVFEVTSSSVIQVNEYLDFKQFIDPKIFGWDRIPERGPISVSNEAYEINPQLLDFFVKYLGVVYGDKTKIWLMVDKQENKAYIQLVDSLTLKRYLFAEIYVKSFRKR